MLKPGVGEYFLQLSGLLRPLIQRRWAAMVAHLNRLEESQLRYSFRCQPNTNAKIRRVWEIQDEAALLRWANRRAAERTGGPLRPWSRYPDDTLDNFVVADKRCNGLKSSSLAAADHLTRWTRRFADGSSESTQLFDLAHWTTWDRQPDRTLNVARAIYLRLPNDARLWLRGKEFVAPDSLTIGTALKAP